MVSDEQIWRNALTDEVTGLPNRILFQNRLERAFERANWSTHSDTPAPTLAVVFIDLDRFKFVKSRLDDSDNRELLTAVARRLEQCVLPGGMVARLMGDDFAVLLEHITRTDEAIAIAERIQRELSSPFVLQNHTLVTSASIGLAFNSTNYETAGDMLRGAAMAMYRAKVAGGMNYRIDQAAPPRTTIPLSLNADLQQAIERQEFEVWYQPIVALQTGTIQGFEALVRWNHSDHGLVSPGAFIPLAEHMGLISFIDNLVLYEACQQLHLWKVQFPNHAGLTMSVNLSSKQFAYEDLVGHIEQTLHQTGVDRKNVRLEFTESVVMEEETPIGTLDSLHALNIRLGVDDVGTGYEALNYLLRLPTDMLKIDRSFVQKIGLDRQCEEIVQSIIALAHSVTMGVVAEGIETAAQLAFLRRLQCDYGQGFYFSGPVNKAAAEALLADPPSW
jgi:diguanylate cyclase (GGDEF)-like protein